MSDAPHITYTARPDATPEAELATLAGIYRTSINRYEERLARKKATRPGGPDDEMKGFKNDLANPNYTGT